MNVLGFGSCIKNGRYSLHSRFKNVLNYANNHDLVSLVSTSVGNGPNNIVVTKIPENHSRYLDIQENNIQYKKKKYPIISQQIIYNKDVCCYDLEKLNTRIQLTIDSNQLEMPSKSLFFLLNPKLESNFESSFDQAYLKHIKSATTEYKITKLPEVVAKMKGIGFGLTPSGDDFNCGILYALNYLDRITDLKLHNLISESYKNSLGKNLISNTFLKFAFQKEYYEKFYNLLNALKSDNFEKTIVCAKQVIQTGHSSGADMLTGFLLTMRVGLHEVV